MIANYLIITSLSNNKTISASSPSLSQILSVLRGEGGEGGYMLLDTLRIVTNVLIRDGDDAFVDFTIFDTG